MKIDNYYNVPGRGLEPPWIAPPAPKAGASTSFAIPADISKIENIK